NERAAEIAIAAHLIEPYRQKDQKNFHPVWSKNAPSCILEVGNVLSNFMPCNHIVVDKFEKASGVLNVDIVDYRSTHKFDFIISISTFEHI
ncbi:hypothetical protein ACI3PL_22195, partial [Lacticaseibacillus paracasei]